MSTPFTDEQRSYLCRAYLIRATDDAYARHMAAEAVAYGATEQQIADAWATRAAINAPTVIRGAA